METEFEFGTPTKFGHNLFDCDQCKLIEEKWL